MGVEPQRVIAEAPLHFLQVGLLDLLAGTRSWVRGGGGEGRGEGREEGAEERDPNLVLSALLARLPGNYRTIALQACIY